MQFVKPDIQTVCIGQASSAAAVVLAAGTTGKRCALPNAKILLHQPFSQGYQGQVSDLEIQAREMIRIRDQLEGILAKHTGKDVERIQQDIERDHVLTAQQALEYGLIDQVIAPRNSSNAGSPDRHV
jgi:ATP-dependent Clp protease protease subunit